MSNENTPSIQPKPLEDSPKFEPVVVPDDVYLAKVKAYRIHTHPTYGESLIIDFEILDGEHKGKVIGGFASWQKITKKTKLYRWASNLNAPVPTQVGEVFNPEGLIGKTGKILTAQIEKVDNQGKKYWQSIVKDVLRAEGSSAPTPSQQTQTTQNTETQTQTQATQSASEEKPQNKFDILKQFKGKEFTAEDLTKAGFSETEIDSLNTMGYIFEVSPGKFKLTE